MDYRRFFESHDRLASQKQIGLIKSDLMNEFVSAFVDDHSIETKFKALVLISLSGGLRVSEAFKLKKEDFLSEDGVLYIRVSVLKKKRREKRWARIHPLALEFIQNYISTIVGPVVRMSQPTAYRKTKKYFGVAGVCNHSLRHSNISYMLFEENMNHIKLAKLLHINVNTIEHYSHLNEKRTLKSVFVA
ncbi:MAG: tyrosine-type recombinase/integrase [Pseudobdellovibrionaceae bacterium]